MKKQTVLYMFIALLSAAASAAFADVVTSTSSRTLHEEAPLNRDIKSLSMERLLTQDGEFLFVTMKFSGVPVLNPGDKLILLLDDSSLGGKKATEYRDRGVKNPATFTTVDASVDYSFVDIPGEGRTGACRTNYSWKLREDGLYEASREDLSFMINIDYIMLEAKKAKGSDSFRLVAFISDLWKTNADPKLNGTSHVIDVAPASGVAIGHTQTESDTVAVFFSKALILE